MVDVTGVKRAYSSVKNTSWWKDDRIQIDMEDHRKRRNERSLETGACLKIIFLDLGLPEAPKLLRTVTGLSSSRARLRSMRSWKTSLGTKIWLCSLPTALWSIEKPVTTLNQSWCSPVWRQQWLIKTCRTFKSYWLFALRMGWMLPSMCLLVPLKMPTAVAASCCWLPNSPEELSDCILEGAGNTLKLKDQMMNIFVDKLCVYDTCVHPLRHAFICSIHVTYRYIIWLCKQYAQQKASVPPAKHTQLLEARLLPCDVWHLQYYIGIKLRGLHLLTSCVPGIECC